MTIGKKIFDSIVKGKPAEAKKALYKAVKESTEEVSVYKVTSKGSGGKLEDEYYIKRGNKWYGAIGTRPTKKTVKSAINMIDSGKMKSSTRRPTGAEIMGTYDVAIKEAVEISDKIRIDISGRASELDSLYDALEDAGIELQSKEGSSFGYVEVSVENAPETISKIRAVVSDLGLEEACKVKKSKKMNEASNDFDYSIEGTNLRISANVDDDSVREQLEDWMENYSDDVALSDLLEVTGWQPNGQLYTISPEDVGALTDAPMLSDDVDIEDDGTVNVRGNVWYYADYMTKDWIEELLNNGFVLFKSAGKVEESITEAKAYTKHGRNYKLKKPLDISPALSILGVGRDVNGNPTIQIDTPKGKKSIQKDYGLSMNAFDIDDLAAGKIDNKSKQWLIDYVDEFIMKKGK